jgi:hypothetical protein
VAPQISYRRRESRPGHPNFVLAALPFTRTEFGRAIEGDYPDMRALDGSRSEMCPRAVSVTGEQARSVGGRSVGRA